MEDDTANQPQPKKSPKLFSIGRLWLFIILAILVLVYWRSVIVYGDWGPVSGLMTALLAFFVFPLLFIICFCLLIIEIIRYFKRKK